MRRWRRATTPRANQLIDVMLDFEEIRAEEQNGTNVTAVKAALQLMGEDCGPTAAALGLAAHGGRRWPACVPCSTRGSRSRQEPAGR